MSDTCVGSVDKGGSAEVYADQAGAEARKKYIDDTMKAMPMLGTEYSYIDGPVLLRVSQVLTPNQAAEYQAALQPNLQQTPVETDTAGSCPPSLH